MARISLQQFRSISAEIGARGLVKAVKTDANGRTVWSKKVKLERDAIDSKLSDIDADHGMCNAVEHNAHAAEEFLEFAGIL